MSERRNQVKAGERKEDVRPEAQERKVPTPRVAGARSPVDRMHVDAPRPKNAHANRGQRGR